MYSNGALVGVFVLVLVYLFLNGVYGLFLGAFGAHVLESMGAYGHFTFWAWPPYPAGRFNHWVLEDFLWARRGPERSEGCRLCTSPSGRGPSIRRDASTTGCSRIFGGLLGHWRGTLGTACANDFLEKGVFEKGVLENSVSRGFEPIENPDEENKVDSLFFDEPWALFERALNVQGLKTPPTCASSLADSDDEIAAPKSRRSEA